MVSNECTYESSWVGAPIGDVPHFRCVKDKCVKTPSDLPGLDGKTCQETCGPLKGCLLALYHECDASRKQSPDQCNFCTGEHHLALGLAGCTATDYHKFCDVSKPVAAPCTARPTVGSKVVVHSADGGDDCRRQWVGQSGQIYNDDDSDEPYQIQFGLTQSSCWFTPADLWCLPSKAANGA